VEAFFQRHAARQLSDPEKVRALKLLEMQRHSLLMYTSCAWFFAEISGLETVQTLVYAARAIQLANEVARLELEAGFLEHLAFAPSNLPHLTESGREVYLKRVKPSMATLRTVVGHYAMRTMFPSLPPPPPPANKKFPSPSMGEDGGGGEGRAPFPPHPNLPPPGGKGRWGEGQGEGLLSAYAIEDLDIRRESRDSMTLAMGRVQVRSRLTWDRLQAIYAVLRFGGHEIRCAVVEVQDASAYAQRREEWFRLFLEHPLADVMRALEASFGGDLLAFTDLFLDERRRIGQWLLEEALARYTGQYREIYQENQQLMHFLRRMSLYLPPALRLAAELTLNGEVLRVAQGLTNGQLPVPEVVALIAALRTEAKCLECVLDVDPLRRAFETVIQQDLEALPHSSQDAQHALQALAASQQLQLGLHLWQAQNLFWRYLTQKEALADSALLLELGKHLGFDRAIAVKLLATSLSDPAK
jgi:hypothetical protein